MVRLQLNKKTRRVIVISLCSLAVIYACGLVLSLVFASPNVSACRATLRIGMTKDEVRTRCGSPSVEVKRGDKVVRSRAPMDNFFYMEGSFFKTLLDSFRRSRGPRVRDHILIQFDNGRVVHWTMPRGWTRYKRLPQDAPDATKQAPSQPR